MNSTDLIIVIGPVYIGALGLLVKVFIDSYVRMNNENQDTMAKLSAASDENISLKGRVAQLEIDNKQQSIQIAQQSKQISELSAEIKLLKEMLHANSNSNAIKP